MTNDIQTNNERIIRGVIERFLEVDLESVTYECRRCAMTVTFKRRPTVPAIEARCPICRRAMKPEGTVGL